MKHRGGLPPAFQNRGKLDRTLKNQGAVVAQKFVNEKSGRFFPSPPRQTARSGLSQLFGRPSSPFSGPGPSTAGRKTRRRKHRVRR